MFNRKSTIHYSGCPRKKVAISIYSKNFDIHWNFVKEIDIHFYITFKVIVNYKYFICEQKFNSINSNVIICFVLTPFLLLPSQTLLPSPFKLHNFTNPNGSLMSVCCVCVHILHLFHIRDIRYRIEISFCVFN